LVALRIAPDQIVKGKMVEAQEASLLAVGFYGWRVDRLDYDSIGGVLK
jgi:hypothetical protein